MEKFIKPIKFSEKESSANYDILPPILNTEKRDQKPSNIENPT